MASKSKTKIAKPQLLEETRAVPAVPSFVVHLDLRRACFCECWRHRSRNFRSDVPHFVQPSFSRIIVEHLNDAFGIDLLQRLGHCSNNVVGSGSAGERFYGGFSR